MLPLLAAAAPYIATAAGGLIGALGSKGKKGDRPQTQESGWGKSTQQTLVPDYMTPQLYSYANLLNEAIPQRLKYFPGQGYVSPSEMTQQGWRTAQAALPYYQQAAQLAQQGIDPMSRGAALTAGAVPGMQGLLNIAGMNYGQLSNAADVANNPQVQAQLAANQGQVTQALREQWLPQIQNQAVAGGAMGASRQGLAQAQGIERAAEQLSRTNAATMLNAYGQGLSAQQTALGQTGAMLQNQLAPGAALFGAGQMYGGAGGQAAQAGGFLGQGASLAGQIGANQEAYQQQALEDQMNRWRFAQMEPWQRLQLAGAGLSTLNPYLGRQTGEERYGTTVGQTPGSGGSNWLQGAIGGALTGYGIGKDMGWWGNPAVSTAKPPTT